MSDIDINAFLEFAKDKRRVSKRYVDELLEYQQQIGKDISEFSKDDVLAFLRQDTESYFMLRNKIATMNAFYQWRYGDTFKYNIKATEIDLSGVFARTMFGSFDGLAPELERLDAGDVTIPIIIFCWLGLSVDQMAKIKQSDIVFRNDGSVTVNCGGKQYTEKSTRLAMLLRWHFAADACEINTNYSAFTARLADSGYAIRKTLRAQNPYGQATKSFISMKISNFHCSCTNIEYSGMFSRALERIAAGEKDTKIFTDTYVRMTFRAWRKAFGV